MPWNSQLAQVLAICEQARIITSAEYEDIRTVMQEGLDNRTRPTNQERVAVGSDSSQIVSGIKKGSGFVFGKASHKELEGVKVELVLCVRRALELSTQDFCVYDGLRTAKEQAAHVKNGTSKTMQSKHLQGLAVDLVPWINGGPKWDWDGCYKIAWAMDQAATEQGIAHKIRWGGAWDRRLSDYGNDAQAYVNEVRDYTQRHEGKDFIDGPHFEWVD